MTSRSDAWRNLPVRRLLLDLTDRGVRVRVRGGRLELHPAAGLTADELQVLRTHKQDAMVLTLACNEAVVDRLLDLRAGRLGRAVTTTTSHCHMCSGPLPADRHTGRCGWCALASRLYAGAPIDPDVLRLFPADIRGPVSVPAVITGPLLFDVALPFDLAVPA